VHGIVLISGGSGSRKTALSARSLLRVDAECVGLIRGRLPSIALSPSRVNSPANLTPAYATNEAVSFAALNLLVMQVSWIQPLHGLR